MTYLFDALLFIVKLGHIVIKKVKIKIKANASHSQIRLKPQKQFQLRKGLYPLWSIMSDPTTFDHGSG